MKIVLHDGSLKEIDKASFEAFETLNHSTSHLLAAAIHELYPKALFGFGPAISEGFYYDIDFGEVTISENDLPLIEKKMHELAAKNEKIERISLTKEEALDLFKDDKYKLELIEGITEDITAFKQGDFIDLCRGPHILYTGLIKHFKLLNLAGAYWRGNSKNKQLLRIYGCSYWSEEELQKHLADLEERKERDHRKLGKDLGIFMMDELVGKGLPMWLPNGFTLRRILSDYITDKEISYGYQHVITPSLGHVDLYKTSGHWDHYKDDMFPAMEVEEEAYVLRPMNCPHHMVMFASKLHSYRDLPVRLAEIANDFRYEASGALTGIERTRAFTQNDSHIFCRHDQIASEVKEVTKLILEVYKDFNITEFEFRLSLRDPDNTEKYFGNDALWEKSESELRQVLSELNVPFYEAKGEAAFYGPKIDIQVKSVMGHDITLSTIQLDYQLPERFDLTYINENGEKERPIVIHRAILGSLDRFVAFLLEETKGVLPLWLAPVQLKILPVNPFIHSEYCDKVYDTLKDNVFRVNKDYRNEKLGYKIREAQINKIPYQLVIGDEEVKNHTVTYRKYGEKNQVTVGLTEFVGFLKEEVLSKGNKK